jgi:DNA primase
MPTFFDNNDILRIQQANDIVDLVAEHISLTKKGKEMVGLCPFHQDSRPSMNVSPAKQIFKCFACGAGGDVFKFVQMRESLTFPQAVERLAERAGIELKPSKFTRRDSAPQETTGIDPNKLARLNAWAAKIFHQNLKDPQKGASARKYLEDRSISAESIDKWLLGLALGGNDLIKRAAAQNIPIKLLQAAGLATHQNQDKFQNRLMFPIVDAANRHIGIGGRTLDGSGAKYINSPTTALFDKSNSLYGLNNARHNISSQGSATLVEGYTDVIMAHQFGLENVVATLGTSLTAGHGRILRRYAKNATLLFDGDVAGAEAANRALEVCLSQHMEIALATIPGGQDPCDYLLENGKDAFEKVIASATGALKFKWSRLREKFKQEDSIHARKDAIDQYLQAIAVSLQAGRTSPIEQGLIVNQLASLINLDPKQINDELNKRAQNAKRTASYTQKNQQVRSFNPDSSLINAAGTEIIEVLLNEPHLFEIVKQTASIEDFHDQDLKKIAELLFEALEESTEIQLNQIIARIESEELASAVINFQEEGEKKENYISRLKDALETLNRYREKGKTQKIKELDAKDSFLKHVCEKAEKNDRYNLGMV